LKTNFLDYVNAGVLSQIGDNGLLYLYPIIYYLKTIVNTKLNYPIYNKEMLAIIFSF
ncbi:uncharacterized protein K441DRAFT_556965, partial [Cenococcum geophilum 1.58]|uniref:uncharacterized protein n=1 Tax=Cenococcum geophilum 1.58 TaxID=794803 RepID=UPI00358E7302